MKAKKRKKSKQRRDSEILFYELIDKNKIKSY